VDKTALDMHRVMQRAHASSGRWRHADKTSAAIAVMGVLGMLALLGILLGRLPRQEPTLFQRGYVLPSPAPIPNPAVSSPTMTVTPPPAVPQVILLPPPRRSLWEIRAELKRGLGEWEFPHYVNAPHYGSGPDSPLPSPLKPHLASLRAE